VNCPNLTWYCTGYGPPPNFICYTNAAQTSCIGPCWAYNGTQAGGTQAGCGCPFTTQANWH
jgi:hypothetical protein